MLGPGTWLRKATLLLALCAGGIGASAPAPQAAQWKADPDDQFLLDVNIRQLRLGDGVRAYNTPEGTCVVLGDFLTTLDVPMHIDLLSKKASGWAFKEKNRISIDYGAGVAVYAGKSEAIAPGTIRETAEGWCVQTTALSRWFGISVKPVTTGSVLVLQSDEKLPVELAMERQQRAAHLHPTSFDLSTLPQVRVPYRLWRSPALDFVVSAGVTYRASDGLKVDRESSVYAAGEIARLSYDAQLTTTPEGKPSLLRLRAYRSDPDGRLLGFLHATHIGVGDVEGFDSGLSGTASSGRGAVVTNRPLATRVAFDRTRFEGDLPSGWEAEIYRNGELLGFAKPDGSQRYVFDNVELLYGENQIEIRLYGPQGQIRTRDEVVDVGQDNVPKGKTWYWAGFNQPGRDILELEKPPDVSTALQPKAQAAISVEHGIDDRTSVGVLARAMLIGDERLTFLEGNVRRSIGGALVELGASRESNGGVAAHAQLLGKIGAVNVSAEALLANDFHLQGGPEQSARNLRVALDAPLHVGRSVFPAHGEVQMTDHRDGTRELDAAARLSANFDRFNLATEVGYKRQYVSSGLSQPAEVSLGLIGTGHIGDVRLRAGTSFDVSPRPRFQTAELSAYWSKSDKVDWEGDLAYDQLTHRARVRISHVRRLDSIAVAFTGEAATDGSVAFGVNLNFSLDPSHGLSFSRRPLAQAGAVHAVVYRDLNDNGVHDPTEPYEKGVLVTTGTMVADHPTNAQGAIIVGGLTAYQPITVGLDQSSLSDPMLVPKKALQVVVPRPGVPAQVEIALVGGGDIEGAVIKSADLGFEGLDLELVDSAGKVVGTAQTDFDGFFLFDRVPYGSYTIRVAKNSATRAKIIADLGVKAQVSIEKPVARIGIVHPQPVPQIASVGGIKATR
ncbi:MAG TPA: carboxypeptidase-like regulatory domain-containing protein [Sphingomicrobium sp.]|nr:carboxypeptidase-like regulatory domain-containing protein [Sphingomicrobium sp.]